jgi:DNA-binding NarL/FixJ family response regulator
MYKFEFSRAECDRLLQDCGFSRLEQEVFERRRRGESTVEMAMALHVSEATIQRKIKSAAKKIMREI